MGYFYRAVTSFLSVVFKLLYRHRVYGAGKNFPESAIIAANHVSFFDPILVSISYSKDMHFLARQSLFRFSFFGMLIKKLQAHPIQKGALNITSIKLINRLLRSGKRVLIFPEGKRSDNGNFQKLLPGVGTLSVQNKVCIIPVYLHGSYEVWSNRCKFPKLYGKTACVFGSPILYEEIAGLGKKEAVEECTKRLESAILALKAWYEDGATGEPP